MSTKKATPGVSVRHSKGCSEPTSGRCGCTPTYQAHVFDARSGKRIRKTFPTRAAAKLWRQDAVVAVRSGALEEARPKTTMREAGEAWMDAARAGSSGRAAATSSSPARCARTARRSA